MSMYNEDYYERGLQTGVSLYQNYRWMPEMTMAMAMVMIDYLDIPRGASVLDFGCAKGYLVKALQLLGRDAVGVDTSIYALDNVDPDVKEDCWEGCASHAEWDFVIAKDVFEHLTILELEKELNSFHTKKLFAIIPLGAWKKYNAPSNDLDITHNLCLSSEEWIEVFAENGWETVKFTHRIDGIKDHYYEKFPKAHGFFTLERAK